MLALYMHGYIPNRMLIYIKPFSLAIANCRLCNTLCCVSKDHGAAEYIINKREQRFADHAGCGSVSILYNAVWDEL